MNYSLLYYDICYHKAGQLLQQKINAQIDFDYDLENLDYMDKPIDSRIYLEHLDKIEELTKKLDIVLQTKKNCLKQIILKKTIVYDVPEDCVNYLAKFI
tara:strand:- start:600 stop:896 length:297 start_codon:yes stop_codon:yes gene_type:complete